MKIDATDIMKTNPVGEYFDTCSEQWVLGHNDLGEMFIGRNS